MNLAETMERKTTTPMDRGYFFDADDAMTDYLTAQGIAAFETLEASYHLLRERAYRILVILLAGAGGAIGLFFSQFESAMKPSGWGLLVFSFGWSLGAFLLIFGCLTARERPIAGSDPGTLYFQYEDGEKVTLADLKRLRLYDYADNFKKIQDISRGMSRYFNGVLMIAAGTPVVAILVFWHRGVIS
jgi:hypothetical protein